MTLPLAEALRRLKRHDPNYGSRVFTESSERVRERAARLFDQAAVEEDFTTKLEMLRRAGQYNSIADCNQIREIHGSLAHP